MLIQSIIEYHDIIGAILKVIDTIFIQINGLVYTFISFLYQIFLALSSATIFTSKQYQAIADRVYILIGVVSLFLIAYALLRAIINPENASKGDYAVGKIVTNVLKVVVLIAFTPTIFSYAYRMQEVITGTNVIPKIILGDSAGDLEKKISVDGSQSFSYKTAGRGLANEIFLGFLHPVEGVDEGDIQSSNCLFGKCGEVGDDGDYSFKYAHKLVSKGEEDFETYANFAEFIHGNDKSLEYNGIFQLVAGIFVIYVFFNYCIDLGLRAIKLGYFQLLAPIPILTILIPGQDKIFKNWLKNTVSTFLDVFMRIAIIFFGMLIIQMLPKVGDTLWQNSLFDNNESVQNFARVFIILGILLFIKQAPKLISDITGLNTGSFKLGIKDKLGEALDFSSTPGLGRAQGALTGAAGAAWTAKANGGNVMDGLKWGAMNGLKGKGNQFNKQRQSMWSDVYGLGGTAGWFGGKPWYGQKLDDVKNRANDRFLEPDKNKVRGANSLRVEAMEKSGEFLSIQRSKEAEINAAIERLRNAESKYEVAMQTYKNDNDRINRELAAKQSQVDGYNQAYNTGFEKAKADYIANLNAQRDAAVASGNTAAVMAYGQKIDSANAGHSNSDILNYAKNNNSALYNSIQSADSNRAKLQGEIVKLNNNLASNNEAIKLEAANKASDKSIETAKQALEKYKLLDSEGKSMTSAYDISAKSVQDAVYKQAKAQYKKENEEYAWRVSAEDAEKREVEIKEKRGSVDYQMQKELFEGALKKFGGSDKK